MRFLLIAIVRSVGVVISLGIILGYIWYFEDHKLLSIGPPVFLLTLSMLPLSQLSKFPSIAALGIIFSGISLVQSGIPFVRGRDEIDVEIIFGIQWVLIFFFLFYFCKKVIQQKRHSATP
jgi:hypothetical protein